MRESSTDRLWFLDCVRYWAVLAVVVLHVAMSQMTLPWGWPVSDSRQLVAANWLVVITASFVMPVLFFVAGYFTLPSLAPKGPKKFLWAKLKRLVIPGALVVILLNPVFRYVYHFTRGFDEEVAASSYWTFWPRFFDGALAFSVWEPATTWSPEFSVLHIWFITVLFLFFAITAGVVAIKPQFAIRPAKEESTPPTTRGLIVLLVVVTLVACAGTLAVSLLWKNAWVKLGFFLVFLSSDILFHILYFSLGILAYRQHWFRSPGRLGSVWGWLTVCVVLTPVTCSFFARQAADVEGVLATDVGFQVMSSLSWGFLCLGFLGFLLTFTQRFFNQRSRFHQHMAAHSYRTYLLHMTVVVLVQFGLWKWSSLSATTVLLAGLTFSLIGTHLFSVVVGWVQSLTWKPVQ